MRAIDPERYEALKDEVNKLIDNRFIPIGNRFISSIDLSEIGTKPRPSKEAQWKMEGMCKFF